MTRARVVAFRCARAGHLTLFWHDEPPPTAREAPVYRSGRGMERGPCGCPDLTPFELDRRTR